MDIGTRVKVFKEKEGDTYHRIGDWKKGIILQKLPNFYLVLLEGNYKECFYESEVFKLDEDINAGQEGDV